MVKATIFSWKDGDSGEMILNGVRRRFRLSHVDSPERNETGYGMATARSKNVIPEGTDVEMKIVGKDAYGRAVVELSRSGRDINSVLERANEVLRPKTPTRR